MRPKWKFEDNSLGVLEGPNNAGISNFTNDRASGLVREILQNSIDARDSYDQPVEVTFAFQDMPVSDFDIKNLTRALSAAAASDDNDDRHRKQFNRAVKLLRSAQKKGTLSALLISDRNTTGAPDIDGRQDKWWSLTMSVGKSQKDARDAGGSYGIGKHAVFAATDMRTALYSTAFNNPVDGSLERRFTGKTILVSHEIQGKAYKSTGYLMGKDGGDSDGFIPEVMRLDSSGTSIAVLGFPSGAERLHVWKREAIESLVGSFFHALVHRNLTVDLQGTTISHTNVDALAQAISDERLCNLVEVSRTETVSHTDIEGIGRVNLRIIVDREGRNHDKVLALVRDSGMMITDRLGSMRVSRSQAMVAFPRSWHGFTAIVECLSKGERSLLREAEGPRHNEISPDNADETERGDVAKCLRELGSWVRSEIELLAKPPEPSRSDNASEMAGYLPLPGEGSSTPGEDSSAGFELSEARQSSRPPAGLGIPSGGRRRGVAGGSGPGGSGGAGGKGPGKRSRRRRGQNDSSVVFQDMRRLPSSLGQWPDHTARFAFDMPDELPKRIRLYAVGEDGSPEQMPIERAYYNGRRLKVAKGEIVEMNEKQMSNRRVQIEIKGLRPIADRRLEVRSV